MLAPGRVPAFGVLPIRKDPSMPWPSLSDPADVPPAWSHLSVVVEELDRAVEDFHAVPPPDTPVPFRYELEEAAVTTVLGGRVPGTDLYRYPAQLRRLLTYPDLEPVVEPLQVDGDAAA